MAGPDPQQLAEAALDPTHEELVAEAISKLSPEEAQHFIGVLERAIRSRRIQLTGYLLSLVILLGGMFGALLYVGNAPPGTFVGWVFFVPILAVAVTFYLFGRWANRIKRK